MPRASMTPGRKFSTTTSAVSASRWKSACPSGRLISRVRERLLRFAERKKALMPEKKGGPAARLSSPTPGFSTLMTSAPRSPNSMAQVGPARWRPRSSTRTPVNGIWAGSVPSTIGASSFRSLSSLAIVRLYEDVSASPPSAAHEPGWPRSTMEMKKLPASPELVNCDGQQEHHASHGVLIEGLDVHQAESVIEAAHQEGPEQRAEDGAPTPRQRGAADDSGGD